MVYTWSDVRGLKECLRSCLGTDAFWDLYGDIALPGGIALHSFVGTWTQHCLAMDTNDLSKLPFPNGIVVPMLIRRAWYQTPVQAALPTGTFGNAVIGSVTPRSFAPCPFPRARSCCCSSEWDIHNGPSLYSHI